jgi:hypothetical protein
MRHRLLGVVATAFAVAACSDSSPSPTSLRPDKLRSTVITPTGTLDQNIQSLLSLWPTGLETSLLAQWNAIKTKYAAGQTDPASLAIAKEKLVTLVAQIQKKTADADQPPNSETREAMAARVILYMSLYIYNGPNTTPPDYTAGADAAVGILTPSAPLTVVTPSQQAGAQFPIGSTDVNRIIVITQNPTPYPDNCSGPLQTTACQYPLFYFIESFPGGKLLQQAKAAICHVDAGTNRYPLADHDRFRLAHAKPANPSDYTAGSTIRDNIEILPLITQSFVTCSNVQYASTGGNLLERGARFASSLLGKLVTPKSAFAIDQGGGGGFEIFSPFNNVDPQSQPDLDVQSFSPPSGPININTPTTITFSVKNIGTGTNNASSATVRLSTDNVITASDPLIATVSVPSLPPGSTSTTTSLPITIPAVPTATYYIGVLVDDVPATPDLDLSNNTESASLSVVEPPGPSPIVIDFETPNLGASERMVSNPYASGYVTFTSIDPSFSDDVVGIVKNSLSTSACVPPISANQKLGTGRYPFSPDGAIGLSGFDIKAAFGTPLNTSQTVSVDVQALGGVTVTLTLYNAGGTQVGTASAVVPSTGVCPGAPGGNRGVVTLSASGTQAAYAIISGPSSVFVIDNFMVQDPIIIL